ncbi:MAG: hypothetical protein ABA06_04500 [Parcubacteria bacterium C7867-001]|nr:MAG: hypothetical protein ABA06_04500 [Parcubacteria bacterium C7867-001]
MTFLDLQNLDLRQILTLLLAIILAFWGISMAVAIAVTQNVKSIVSVTSFYIGLVQFCIGGILLCLGELFTAIGSVIFRNPFRPKKKAQKAH